MSLNIIELREVSYEYYGRIPALIDITLNVHEGEKLAVIGANGSGKSTLMQIMNGLIFPTKGKVFFKGQELSERSLKNKEFMKRFRRSVGLVFQDSDVQLFSPTVFDELIYGPLNIGMDKREAIERVSEVMNMLNIERLKDRPPYMLSGGEKKRVAIGSVLTMNPDVLLFDEPTGGLDPRTQCFLVELLFSLHEAGKTIVIATHDLSLVDELQARVVVLSEEHRLIKEGETGEILGDEKLLLEVNLIHEHQHCHGPIIHRHIHSHYFFHRH